MGIVYYDYSKEPPNLVLGPYVRTRIIVRNPQTSIGNYLEAPLVKDPTKPWGFRGLGVLGGLTGAGRMSH